MRTILTLALGTLLLGCATADKGPSVPTAPVVPTPSAAPALGPPEDEAWASRTLAELSLEEKIGQLFLGFEGVVASDARRGEKRRGVHRP